MTQYGKQKGSDGLVYYIESQAYKRHSMIGYHLAIYQ